MITFREEEAIKLDGLSVAQLKELRDSAEKQTFQAEVDRMMKLIINSLYKNKEVGVPITYLVHSMYSSVASSSVTCRAVYGD